MILSYLVQAGLWLASKVCSVKPKVIATTVCKLVARPSEQKAISPLEAVSGPETTIAANSALYFSRPLHKSCQRGFM